MSDDPAITEALNDAAKAIKRGDLETGRAGLGWVLKRDPNNVLAWLWMSRCVESVEKKLECFNRVLAIDPTNKHALEGVQRFGGGGASQDPLVAPPASSSELPVQDPSKQGSRKTLWLAIGGALIASVFCCGIIALIGSSGPSANVAQEAAPPAGVEGSDDVLVELPTEIPSPTEAPPSTDTPVPTRTPQPSATPVSLAEYADEIILLVLEPWVEGMDQVSELSGEASVSPLLILDDEWRLDMAVALATITIANDVLREIDVPDDMQDAHSALLDAASELDVVAELMAEGIDEIDANKIVAAAEAMVQVNDHIVRANDLLP